MNRFGLMALAALLFGGVAAVSGQPVEDGRASPYFDCPYVNYFDADCPQLREQLTQERQARPGAESGTGRADEGNDEAHREDARQGISPDELILFPRESLAPDAPPLFRTLLANPTLANARRYVHWHARRSAQLQVVQALIRRAGKELETSPGMAPGSAEGHD
ncbi:MAG: hypothetical protein OXP66_15555 [Candidatus Tectomicrobia bacterium]|nr:hypothetical protein [Candidatus Tectomicrobia bacterium]